MGNYQTIRFGLGEVVAYRAKSNGYPAVILEPCRGAPGEVSKDVPVLSIFELREGSMVLEFHGADGAKILIKDIVFALAAEGYDLSPFLLELADKAVPVTVK
jgi:hypothetical protein